MTMTHDEQLKSASSNRQTTTRELSLFAGTTLLMSSLALPALAADKDHNSSSSVASQAMEATGEAWNDTKMAASDAYIKGRLVTAYTLSEHLNPFEIDVSVSDGVVRLTGAVSDDIARDLATEIAQGIESVKDVDSQLRLDESLAEDAAEQDGDSFAASFTDATISARVKTQLLWNNNIEGLGIDVSTQERVVTLSGEVETDAQSALAEQITRNTDGVASVVNELNAS